MKISRYTTSPITLAICLVVIANNAQAKDDMTQQLQDISKWTQDQVQAYFDKYNIAYNKNDKNLLETVQKYRDAALVNTNTFITDKSDSLNRMMEGLKTKLEKQYKLSTNSINSFIDDLSHQLKQLELTGHLTQDRVKQTLDQYQKQALKQKYVTEAQWKEIANDLEHSFVHPTWYQRLFGTTPLFDQDAFHTWTSTSLTNIVKQNKDFTKQQISDVMQTLERSIQSTSSDFSKLGSATWWKKLSHDLEKDAKLNKEQIENLIQSMTDEINAYKIFVMDYVGQSADNFFNSATRYIRNKGQVFYQAVYQTFRPSPERQAQVENALVTASSAAVAATQAADASASSLCAQATDSFYDAKDYVVDNANNAKDFVVDNANSAKDYVIGNTDSPKGYADSAKDYVVDSANSAKDYVVDGANSAKDYVSDSANSAKDYVIDSKDNLGKFWRKMELESYRKVGYTEAHINWLENYLSKNFHDKTHLAKESVQNAIQTIRDYLIQAKVQTVASIDTQMKSLEVLIERWRAH